MTLTMTVITSLTSGRNLHLKFTFEGENLICKCYSESCDYDSQYCPKQFSTNSC